MKRSFKLTLVMIMSVLLFTSCRQTPKTVTVVKKDSEEVMKRAVMKQKKLDIPKKYKDSYKNKKGTLKVNIDADIKLDRGIDYPVVEVEKREFTEEEADKIFNQFIGRKSFYKVQEAWTKPEIEEHIIEMKKELADQGDGEQSNGMTTKQLIKYLKQKLKEAPETDKIEPASEKFVPYKSGKRIFGYCNQEDGRKSYLCIQNGCVGNHVELTYTNFEDKTQSGYLSADPKDYSKNITIKPMKITKEDAKKKAQDLLDQLGFTGFEPRVVTTAVDADMAYGNDTTKKKTMVKSAYFVVFTKSYNGIPSKLRDFSYRIDQPNQKARVTLEGPDKVVGTKEENEQLEKQYKETWYYESIQVLVDDSGIIGMHYESPSKVSKLVTKKSTLLPFSDIMAVMKRMILVRYQVADEALQCLKGKRIELNLMRINEKNERAKAIYVPVWTLYGDDTLYYDSKKTGPKDEKEETKGTEITSINAVDGSQVSANEFAD